ncbi:MAG: hypothetical protein KJ939_01490 [Nanoarchaeota archaeon]|nr:hypothetical protein [Nanoarchaeota archaeon]MBU4351733.1 hypothetical protein [Nanoarchaeota archaeon]
MDAPQLAVIGRLHYISIHQYLKVKVNSKYVIIDGWARIYGIKFGDYAHGFH